MHYAWWLEKHETSSCIETVLFIYYLESFIKPLYDIYNLRNDTSKIIKETDKGSVVVIWDKEEVEVILQRSVQGSYRWPVTYYRCYAQDTGENSEERWYW